MELGTSQGGSAVWFASMMKLFGLERVRAGGVLCAGSAGVEDGLTSGNDKKRRSNFILDLLRKDT